MEQDNSNYKINENCICRCQTNTKNDRFVGITKTKSLINVIFPIGYNLENNVETLKEDARNLLMILLKHREENYVFDSISNTLINNQNELPIQAYLYVIDYYLKHDGNYYFERESTYIVDSKGKTNWPRTIKRQVPLMQDTSFIYLKTIVRKNTPNLNRLITLINKYCVYESFNKVGWLYKVNSPERVLKPESDNVMISLLVNKLQHTNNDEDKMLFNSMISIINFMNNNNGDFTYGTYNFEYIWEKLIDINFGTNNEDKTTYCEYNFEPNVTFPSSKLRIDTLMEDNDSYYVLDAKYYKYGVTNKIGDLPGSSDINKQITYGSHINQFYNKEKDKKEVYNAFILPFNSKDNNKYKYLCFATGKWIDKDLKNYNRVQVILLDTKELLTNYNKKDKTTLINIIKGNKK